MLKTSLSALAALLVFLGFTTSSLAGIEVGQPAPGFRLQDQNGEWHTLDQYAGSWVALYFYPKDDTPGCTKEACAFRDNIFAFEEIGAIILGVSLDDVESHAKFAEKYSLPFSLLADTEGDAATKYGVLKKMVGMSFARRESFLIDPNGLVQKHYKKVNAEQHSEEVLADLRSMISATPET